MKALIANQVHFGDRTARWTAVALIILALASPALAALGGTLDSIQSAHVNVPVNVNQAGAYSVYEMQLPTGTALREYVSPAGRVFGVAWQGPFVPDLRLLLGSYFEQYSRLAKARRAMYVGRHPLDIREPGLVVQTAGHMRAYWGRAYDPGLLPPGVGADEIR